MSDNLKTNINLAKKIKKLGSRQVKRDLYIIAYLHMFKYPLNGDLYIIAYIHMFKYPLNGDFYIIAYIHMFKDRTYHLTMVIVAGWLSYHNIVYNHV